MKKLLTGTAIVFLMIFTAGLATAITPAPPAPPAPTTWTFTSSAGTLWFIADATGTVTSDAAVTITLTQVAVPANSGQPANLFTGSLTIPSISGTAIPISAIGEGGAFRIVGSNPVLSAEGWIERTVVKSGNTKVVTQQIFLRGVIQDPTVFSGNFEGVLLKQQ